MAKKKDYKKLSDSEIVALVDTNISTAVGYHDSELSEERINVQKYYNGDLPAPSHAGNSKYRSSDVYDAVQSMSAALLETFSAGSKAVKFQPTGAEDVKLAEVATQYCDYVAHSQNDLYKVNSTVIHDGLTNRAGIVKIWWETQEETVTEYFEDFNDDELDQLLSLENVELGEYSEDANGVLSGEVRVTRDTSQVMIENVAPEEFLIEPQAKSLDSVLFCAHRSQKTLSDLRLDGYSEKLLAKIGTHNDVTLETGGELLARHDSTSSGIGRDNEGYQDQVRTVMVHEAYIELDVDGTGVAETWRILKAGNALLSKDRVARKPFLAFVPLPVPHAFFGSNFADKIVPTQNARTVLTRSILDHAVVTTNPRYMVMKGALTNPRELADNRVGGLVNVSRPDAVTPMLQAPLNPFIFQTIAMLNDNREETTGVSSLSQGLNKDAVSKQNSAAMVEQLATMSQQRQKIIARNFATQFLKPLYLAIYQLVIENETQQKMIQVAGDYVPVEPGSWSDKRDVTVALTLGYGEQEKEAQKYMAMHQLFANDPTISQMYSATNQYVLMSKVMELSGIKNVGDYLTPPEQVEPKQPDAEKLLNLELMKKQIEIQDRQTAVGERKQASDAEIAQLRLELDKMKAQNTHAVQSDSVDLKEAQLMHKKIIDAAELVMAQQADQITAIASPNG